MGGYALITLLSLCCGLLNSARGSGIKNMKPVVLLAIMASAYTVTGNTMFSVLAPFPLLLWWWYGTGEAMPYLVKYLPWRVWETIIVFIGMWVSLVIKYHLTN